MKIPNWKLSDVVRSGDNLRATQRNMELSADRRRNAGRAMMEDAFNTFPNAEDARHALLQMITSRQTSDQNYDTARDIRDYATQQRGAGQ